MDLVKILLCVLIAGIIAALLYFQRLEPKPLANCWTLFVNGIGVQPIRGIFAEYLVGLPLQFARRGVVGTSFATLEWREGVPYLVHGSGVAKVLVVVFLGQGFAGERVGGTEGSRPKLLAYWPIPQGMLKVGGVHYSVELWEVPDGQGISFGNLRVLFNHGHCDVETKRV